MLRTHCKDTLASAALSALSIGLVAGALYAPLPAFATRTLHTPGCSQCIDGGGCAAEVANGAQLVYSGPRLPATRCVDYDHIWPAHCATFYPVEYHVYIPDGRGGFYDSGDTCVSFDCKAGTPINNRPCVTPQKISGGPDDGGGCATL